MGRPYDESPISVIEDLDPETLPKPGHFQVREFILGVMLLLGVLGFAGWQWWQAESNSSNYRAAQQAVARKDWDAAHTHFSAAHGYKDADAQDRIVSGYIAERNKSYASAVDHLKKSEWASALLDLREVEKQQPLYRDTGRMQTEAEGHVYSDALLGVVVMRPNADPPGLYYRAAAGWVWLEGSDATSVIHGDGSPDRVVYDGPDGVAVPRAGSKDGNNPAPDRLGGLPPGRKLLMATLSPEVATSTLKARSLPLYAEGYSYFTWGQEGTWALKYKSSWDPPAPGPVRSGLPGINSLAYVSFNSPVTSTVSMTPDGKDSLLMAFASSSDQYLYATWTTAEDKNTTVNLFIASASGVAPRLLYTHKGGFVGANFSRDGRYVLLSTFTPLSIASTYGVSGEDRAVLLLDTSGANPPRVVAQQKDVGSESTYVSGIDLRAQFINQGPFAGQVLVSDWMSRSNSLKVLDPTHPDVPTALYANSATGDRDFSIIWSGSLFNSNRLVVSGQSGDAGPDVSNPEVRSLTIVSFVPAKPATVSRIPLERNTTAYPLFISESYLCYISYSFESQGQDTNTLWAYSLPLESLAQANPKPIEIAKWTYKSSDTGLGYSPAFGQQMVAYLDGRDLHARTYDGKIDLKLESSVTAIYDLQLINRIALLN